MAKQAVKARKAETPDAVKATAKPVKEMLPATVKPSAIQAGVGIEVLQMLAQAEANESQINQLRQQNLDLVGTGTGSGRGRAQVKLAMGIYSAAIADETIRNDLPKTYQGRKETQYLNKRLRIALGMAKADGVETDEARSYQYKVDGDDPATLARKESIRANFATMLRKATQVALKALDDGFKLEVDKASGLLRITDAKKGGGAVKQQFGETSVLLNEKQSVPIVDKKGQIVGEKPLKVKPSFSEVLRTAGTKYGKTVIPRGNTPGKTVSTNEHIVTVCGDLVKMIEKLPEEIPEPVRKAMESLKNAIDEKLL